MNAEAIHLKRHKLTATDYHRMSDAGILAHDARVELIEGEIIDIALIGSKHGSVVDKLNRLLNAAVGEQAIVRVQGSIRLGTYTEPQPDIALLKYRSDFYETDIPTANDVVLIVEVADSMLAYDRDVKASLYARAGVPEYWLIDVNQTRISFYRQPVEGRYENITTTMGFGRISLVELEGVTVDLSGLL